MNRMCFSAQTVAAYRRFEREFGAVISLQEFVDLYGARFADKRIKIPKAMDLAFADPRNDGERQVQALIDRYAVEQASELEQEVFAQRTRLAEAERKLLAKPTKAAADSQRIATDKVDRAMRRLADLRRTEPQERDARIFPGVYAAVIVEEHGQRSIKPMRYQCRPAGKPAFYDTKYPGTYNARRDNLEGFWKGLFGVRHGLLVVSAFYENVSRPGPDGLPQNVVLQFRPDGLQQMLVACLWSRWSAPGEPELLSFAAITDEPPAEVAAAGHDRCIVPIKPEHVDAWLRPDPADLAASHAILDDRERPFYEHRLAA
jgi:putative SOS response-associated peptidase YedK